MDFHKTKEVVTKRETTLSRILTSKEHGVTDERLVHAIVALGEGTCMVDVYIYNTTFTRSFLHAEWNIAHAGRFYFVFLYSKV